MYAYLKNCEVTMNIAGIPKRPSCSAMVRIKEKMTNDGRGAVAGGTEEEFHGMSIITIERLSPLFSICGSIE
jgi:hypothetical protein